MNTDFFNVFCFNSSLYLKSLRIVLILRALNDDIVFNALLQYDDLNKSNLYVILNYVIMPFISMIISIILSFLYGKLIDCKDDLKDLFIEEEKKMKKNAHYKVEKSKKIEIKIKIYQILKCLKIKIVIFFIIDILFWIFSFYYLVIFYFVYYQDQGIFISQFLVSVLEAILAINPFKSFILAILYKISLKCKCEYLYDFTLFFM